MAHETLFPCLTDQGDAGDGGQERREGKVDGCSAQGSVQDHEDEFVMSYDCRKAPGAEWIVYRSRNEFSTRKYPPGMTPPLSLSLSTYSDSTPRCSSLWRSRFPKDFSVSTGHGASRITRSVTLPRSRCSTPERPWLAMTIS